MCPSSRSTLKSRRSDPGRDEARAAAVRVEQCSLERLETAPISISRGEISLMTEYTCICVCLWLRQILSGTKDIQILTK